MRRGGRADEARDGNLAPGKTPSARSPPPAGPARVVQSFTPPQPGTPLGAVFSLHHPPSARSEESGKWVRKAGLVPGWAPGKWVANASRVRGGSGGSAPGQIRRAMAKLIERSASRVRCLGRGELTRDLGNPTVRINRHHSITLNLRLRVRVLTHGKSWNCLAATAGAHFGGLRTRPIPGVRGITGRRGCKAGTR